MLDGIRTIPVTTTLFPSIISNLLLPKIIQISQSDFQTVLRRSKIDDNRDKYRCNFG